MALGLEHKLRVGIGILGVVWIVGGILVGCGLSGDSKKFECQDVNDCQDKSQTCVEGKCLLVDVDKDGWSQDKDCDDRNNRVYPKAPEICDNKLDDNCDGKTDEEPCLCLEGSQRECGSDKGTCKKGKQTCVKGKWGDCLGGVPTQDEICDGKDNDCNGSIDDGAKDCCAAGEERDCGPKVGLCQAGKQKCQGNNIWTECKGQIGPVSEICDGKDNDCDGKVDNIQDKDDAIRQPCYDGTSLSRGMGECKDGFQTCVQGKWAACQEQKKPSEETCDGKDNDCDGLVDNVKDSKRGLQRECFGGSISAVGKGICRKGVQSCVQGKWDVCRSEQKPEKEICNGKDDDCDGKIDNEAKSNNQLSQTCYHGLSSTRGKGSCGDGTQSCTNGQWSVCQGAVLPKPEICDGKDNDCDGRVDNVLSRNDPLTEVCYSGSSHTRKRGDCRDGTRTCKAGAWTTCQGERTPVNEICDNKDNDCNGLVDEDVTRSCNSVVSAMANKGNCKDGIQACAGGRWLECKGEVKPSKEVCNLKDDDCDGQVDEKDPGPGSLCP